MDGTSRLALPDGTPLQHGLTVACFAERAVVAAAGVVPLAPAVPLWQAALLGCGAVTGIGAVRNVARPRIGESAAVIGCGGVGQQVIAGLVLAGAGTIVAVDRDPAMLELSLARGATHAVDATADDPAAAVRELTGGGVDHAFEVVGRPETMRLAWDCLRAGGKAVVVGLAAVGVEAAFPAIEFLSDKGIKGCYYGSGNPAAELASLVQLAADGRLVLSDVVTQLTDLDGIPEGLERLRARAAAAPSRSSTAPPPGRIRPAGLLAHVRDDVHDGHVEALRTCSTRSLRSQRERVPGCVEITISSAWKRSSASRTAANGTMSPTQPSHRGPRRAARASVRSSRSCAASMAPAWFQESPRPCSAATAGATTRKVELRSSSIRRSSASSSSASTVSFATTSTRDMRHLREDCAADATTASRAARGGLLDLADGERGGGEHDAADQAPDLEREAVDALGDEHEDDARRRSRTR